MYRQVPRSQEELKHEAISAQQQAAAAFERQSMWRDHMKTASSEFSQEMCSYRAIVSQRMQSKHAQRSRYIRGIDE